MLNRAVRSLPLPALAAALLCLAAPALTAQSRWHVSAAAGYATELDRGSFEHGSVSLHGALLRPVGPTLALGLEGGWSRHDRLHQHFEGEDFGGVLVNRDWDRVNDAWHLGPMLRWTPAAHSLSPFVEAGVGVYGLREANTYRTVRQDNGQLVPEFSRMDHRTALAPGVSLGAGVDYYPGGGRVGLGVAARFHGAARPYDDYILGVGFIALQAGVTIR
jgi:hypothetical protein